MQIPYYLMDTSPLSRFKDAFSQLPSETPHFYIAFSGGLDSHILLHAAQQLLPRARLTAIHINHGWHQESKQWEHHCQQVCDALGIPFIAHNVADLLQSELYIKKSRGPEEAARKARYEALTHYLQKDDCLVTGHHLEDQAETLLLQLGRGAGTQGLASMPLLNHCGLGYHLRPLLTWRDQERKEYAQHYQLRWIDDSSNLDMRFRRNFVRHQVLPLLRQQWPDISPVLARTATHCAQANALAAEFAEYDLLCCKISKNCLSISALFKLSHLRQQNTLRYWLQQHTPQPLTTTQFLSIWHLLYSQQKTAQFHLKHLIISRYRDHLYALKPNIIPISPPNTIQWDWTTPLDLPLFGQLSTTITHGQGIRLSAISHLPTLEIRFREGGERFRPHKRSGSHPLKKLYQEWNIPPWVRPYVPLLYAGDECIAVPGYAVAEHHAATADEPSIDIQVMRNIEHDAS